MPERVLGLASSAGPTATRKAMPSGRAQEGVPGPLRSQAPGEEQLCGCAFLLLHFLSWSFQRNQHPCLKDRLTVPRGGGDVPTVESIHCQEARGVGPVLGARLLHLSSAINSGVNNINNSGIKLHCWVPLSTEGARWPPSPISWGDGEAQMECMEKFFLQNFLQNSIYRIRLFS